MIRIQVNRCSSDNEKRPSGVSNCSDCEKHGFPDHITTQPKMMPLPTRTVASVKDWKNCIIAEYRTNAPYRKKYLASLPPEQRSELEAKMENALAELKTVFEQNGGVLGADQIKRYEAGDDPGGPVRRAIGACDTLKFPLEAFVVGPISDSYSSAAKNFRMMDMELPRFASLGELARHFIGKAAGTQAVLTGGPKSRERIAAQIKQRGVVVTIEGVEGNRVATLRAPESKRVEMLKKYKESQRDDNDEKHLWSNVHHFLAPGEQAVYCEGNHTTLVRQIRKTFGAGSYSLRKSLDGRGWMISLK